MARTTTTGFQLLEQVARVVIILFDLDRAEVDKIRYMFIS
jgi:hypothetical protein